MRIKLVIFLAAITSIVEGQPSQPNQKELRELLVNDHQRLIVLRRWDSIFYHEDKLRPWIRPLLRDDKARENAQEILALIGDPEDLRLVVRLAPRSRRDPFSNRWAYRVACALLEPSTEEEWAFLRACALNDYDDRWVDAGAIQTLKLIASPRSLEILKEAQQRNPYRSKSLAGAINYVGSNPQTLRGANLDTLAESVANVIRIGNREGNQKPRYNMRGDKALIDLVFVTSEDRLTYTATFHKIDGLWRLRGVRETLQQFMMRIVEPAGQPFDLPTPPELLAIPPLPPLTLDLIVRPTPGPTPGPSSMPEGPPQAKKK